VKKALKSPEDRSSAARTNSEKERKKTGFPGFAAVKGRRRALFSGSEPENARLVR
jgi:hypothetical protein